MTIKMMCPRCKTALRFGDDLAGKKVRCKDCDRSIRVEALDDPEETDEDDEAPKKKRRRSKNKEMPAWVWLAGGGAGVLILLLGVAVSVYFATRSRRAVPNAPNVLNPPFANKQPAPPAGPGPHIAIMEELQASLNAAADAIAQTHDRASAKNLASRLGAETKKIDALSTRMSRAGRPPVTDIPRLKQLDDQLVPIAKRLEGEIRRLQQQAGAMKLDAVDVFSLDNSMRDFGFALQKMKMMAEAAQ